MPMQNDFPSYDTDVSVEGIEKMKRAVEDHYNKENSTSLTYDEIISKLKPITDWHQAIEFMFDELNSP